MPDIDTLVVKLEARITDFERKMAQAERRASAASTKITRSFSGLGRQLRGALGAIGLGLGIRQVEEYADTWTRVQNQLRVAGVQGADTQRVLMDLFHIAQDNGTAIEPLVVLYSRMAQSQKDLGATSEQLLRFTTGVSLALRVQGGDATSAKGALLQLSQALGGAVVRAEEFNSVNEGARPILQAVAEGLVEAGGSVSKLRALVIKGQVSSQAFFQAFLVGMGSLQEKVATTTPTLSQGFTRLENSVILFIGTLDKMVGASTSTGSAITSLADSIESFASSPAMGSLVSGINAFIVSTQQLGASADALMNNVNFSNYMRFLFGGAAGKVSAFFGAPINQVNTGGKGNSLVPGLTGGTMGQVFPGAGAPKGGIAPGALGLRQDTALPKVSLKDFPIPGGSDPANKKAEKALAKQAKAVKTVEDNLKFEEAQLGRTEREQAIYNELNDAGADINTKAGKAIAEQAARNFDLQKSLERTVEKMDLFRDAAKIGLSTFVGDLREGKSALEALGNALDRVVDRLLDFAFDKVIEGLLGPSGSSASGLLGNLIPRASGGSVSRNQALLVGERGPEVFVPRTAGVVGSPRGGGGVIVETHYHNNAGASVREKQTKTRGGVRLDVMIDDLVAAKAADPSSKISRALTSRGASIGTVRR